MTSTLVEQYRRWFEYEKQSHREVMKSLASVPEANRESESFRKAMTLMGHLIAARQAWLNRLGGPVERPVSLFPTDPTFDDLVAGLDIIEQSWSDYFRRLTETEVEQTLTYQTFDGQGFRSEITDILTHAFGHSFYHRGQIASLVRAAGGEPAKTDFILWSRESLDPPAS